MRTPTDNGGGGQKWAKSCGHLLWMTPDRFTGHEYTHLPPLVQTAICNSFKLTAINVISSEQRFHFYYYLFVISSFTMRHTIELSTIIK